MKLYKSKFYTKVYCEDGSTFLIKEKINFNNLPNQPTRYTEVELNERRRSIYPKHEIGKLTIKCPEVEITKAERLSL